MPATPKTATKKTATPAKTKAPAKAPAKKAAGAAKPAAPKKATGATSAAKRKHPVAADQRRYYVEVAAYYIAERHGFQPGRELEDWTAAEAEIDRLLAEGALNP